MTVSSQVLGYVEVVVFIGTAVWAVSKIRSTTETLSVSMDHLSTAMTKLDTQVEGIRKDFGYLKDRMTRMETKLEMEDGTKRHFNVK